MYVFTRTGTTWTQQAKLLASDGTENDNFGFSVSLDSDTALVGAPGDDDNANASGSVYVFTRSGATWVQKTKLHAVDGAIRDYFGYSVSLDGDTAIVGARQSGFPVNDTGAAYIFTRIGTYWIEQTKLLASDGVASDEFGFSVSLDGDTGPPARSVLPASALPNGSALSCERR